MKKVLLLIFAALQLASCATGPSLISDRIKPTSSKVFKVHEREGEFLDQMKLALQINNKYLLNKWYQEKSGFGPQTGEYIDFGGILEKNIRPTAHNIFSLTTSLKFDVYDPSVTGVSKEDAYKVLNRLISSVAYRHVANNTDKATAWGNHWQSAFWASQIATGAWMVWDQLPADVRQMVAKMAEHEANRYIGYEIPYYRNLQGEIISKGDTKAEENAWNTNMLAIAGVMMPKHPNAEAWKKQLILMQIASYSAPADLESDEVLDGYAVRDVLKGSNINPDGTVVNHKIIHPDYMCAIMHTIVNATLYRMAGIKPLESSLHNADLIYKAMTVNKYNGKTMYQPTADGKASSDIYFPEGNDWGGQRQANYWLMDIMADRYNWGAGQEITPLEWAAERNVEMLRMMNRDTTGQYYQTFKEDRFFSREEWIGFHLAWGYIEYLPL